MSVQSIPRHGFTLNEILGPSPLKDELRRLHARLDGKTPEERIEIARQQLYSTNPETLWAVIKTASITGPLAAPLVPNLLALLTCELFVPYTSIRENGADNASIAGEAAFAIEQIGVPPDCDALRRLLTDPRRFDLPCFPYKMPGYVRGTNWTVVPAALAARLLPLLGDEAFELAPLAVPFLSDAEPDAVLQVKVAMTLLAERARDHPTRAAAPMIDALRKSGLEFAGPTWVAVRSILAQSPMS